jgi:glycosyltransferase involved in cell wall biosynthesis
MKVVFLSTHEAGGTVGGVEQHIRHLSEALVRNGVEVWILVPHLARHGDVTVREEEGVHIQEVSYGTCMTGLYSWTDRWAGGGVRLVFGLLSKLKYNVVGGQVARDAMLLGPDLVHQHDFVAGVRASFLLSRRVPVVWTNHMGEYLLLKRTGLGRWLLGRLTSRFSYAIGPSRELTPLTNCAQYVPNGVDLDFFHMADDETRRAARVSLGLQEKTTVFLCPRRWAPTKGVLYLAQAVSALPENIAGRCTFLFAGTTSSGYPAYERQVIAELHGAQFADVRILGNLDQAQLRQAYFSADVTVIPSLLEATSLAGLESLACGVPVLGTNVGGMPEIVADGETGWLVQPARPDELARMIVSIVQHPDLTALLRAPARQSVEKGFSWDAVAGRVLDIYDGVLQSGVVHNPPEKKE